MAVGLGSMDMPVPAVAEWEWLNWKFPRAVRAGDTIYARWTLTQKRAPVGGSSTAIVVWRVDVHTATGALCAEGEVGASVLRGAQARTAEPDVREPAAEPTAAAGSGPTTSATTPRRGRRRRRTTGSEAPKPKALAAEAAVQAPASAAPPAGSERTASGRRRRRRRPAASAAARNGDNPNPPAATEAPVPAAAAPAPAAAAPATANPLTRAIRRLRRP